MWNVRIKKWESNENRTQGNRDRLIWNHLKRNILMQRSGGIASGGQKDCVHDVGVEEIMGGYSVIIVLKK